VKLSDSKTVKELKKEGLNISRVSEIAYGVGNVLRHRLSSRNEVCDGYRTAVDETAGVTSIAQPAVSV
jgi:hypothetical protein